MGVITLKKNYIGEKNGNIEIVKELSSKAGARRFGIKCNICGVTKNIYYSNWSNSNWKKMCPHDD